MANGKCEVTLATLPGGTVTTDIVYMQGSKDHDPEGLKGIIKDSDWDEIKDGIDYVWTRDSHYVELKENEIYRERFEIMATMEEYIGKYVSNEWVRKNILRQTDADIREIDKEIQHEKEAGEENPDDDEDDL